MPTIAQDENVPFLAWHVRGRTKTEMRRFVADSARTWLHTMCKRTSNRFPVVFDIDDTLIDGNECVKHGFEFMRMLFTFASKYFPVYVVTARPDDQKDNVMMMLNERGMPIAHDRLHLLPSKLYGKSSRYIEEFKWNMHCNIVRHHGGVTARFGDKLWDVAHIDSLDKDLRHIEDRDCYIFFDPRLKGCLSSKLPGA